MRAYLIPGPDQPAALHDVPEPTPEPGEVLVKVAASSLNPHDLHVASGAAAAYLTYSYPITLGTDFSGTVRAVGAGVSDLAPGQRVFGLVREMVAHRGTFADYAAVPRDSVAPIPDGLSDTEAAALGLAALTALRCLEAIAPGAGDVVLVNGATGGVGSYLVQMLAHRGVRVIATAGAGQPEAHVRALGAAQTVDWTRTDPGTIIRQHHPDGIAAVVDLVNHDPAALADLATAVLARPGGRIASTLNAADPARLPDLKPVNVMTALDQPALQAIAELAEQGKLRAPVTQSFDLTDIHSAIDALTAGSLGKIAIRHPAP